MSFQKQQFSFRRFSTEQLFEAKVEDGEQCEVGIVISVYYNAMNRNKEITRLRPDLSAELSTNGDEVMAFFNLTVMPVLRLQNPVLIKFLQQWAQRKSKHFSLYKLTERIRFVKVLLRENALVHQAILGIVHGALTTDECEYLFEHSAVLEKKILKEVEGMVESHAIAI